MKKLLCLYILFLSGVLFYYSYDSWNYIHYAQIINMENAVSQEKICYDLTFEQKEQETRALEGIVSYAKEHQITFVTKDLIPTEDGTYLYHYYVQTTDNQWIYDLIRMTGGHTIDFTADSSFSYLSSNIKDETAAGTFSSYDNRHFLQENEVIRIVSANHLTAIHQQSISFFFDSLDHAQEMQEYVAKTFPDICHFSEVDGHGGDMEAILASYRNTEILFAAGCSLLIIFLLILCLIAKDKKEILILKMHGHTVTAITCRLYLRFLLFLFALFCGALWLIALLWVRSFDAYYTMLVQSLAMDALYAFCCIPFLLGLCAVYIKHTTHVLELKNGQSFHLMDIANVLLKLLISLFILSPFITSFNRLIPSIQRYSYLQNNRSVLEDLYTFSYFNGSREELQELYAETIYFDMSDYAYQCDFTSYLYSGLSLKDAQSLPNAVPLLYVNTTYLLERGQPFYDETHRLVETERIQEKTYLIPTAKKGSYVPDDGDIIYVEDTGTHINLHPDQPLYQIDQPILVVYGRYEGMNIYPQYLLFANHTREEVETMVAQVSDAPFLVHSMSANISRGLVFCEDRMISCAAITMIFAVLYSLFILQFCYLYIDHNKKEMALSYLCGKSRIERYGILWLINLIVYLAIILGAMLAFHYPLSICLEFTMLFFAWDALHMLWFLKRMEKKELIAALRGGS